jgi:hypothetical protein
MDSIDDLVKQRHIIGPPPTLEDLVDPIEEREVGDLLYTFEGGDAKIMAEVLHEMAVAQGKVIELDDDDDGEDDEDKDFLSCDEVQEDLIITLLPDAPKTINCKMYKLTAEETHVSVIIPTSAEFKP